MVTGFSTIPLQFASILSLTLTVLGMGLLAFVLLRYVVDNSAPPGFAFLASVISLFSGARLFSLGVIREYLARIHFRLLDRPSYVVRFTADKNPFSTEFRVDLQETEMLSTLQLLVGFAFLPTSGFGSVLPRSNLEERSVLASIAPAQVRRSSCFQGRLPSFMAAYKHGTVFSHIACNPHTHAKNSKPA